MFGCLFNTAIVSQVRREDHPVSEKDCRFEVFDRFSLYLRALGVERTTLALGVELEIELSQEVNNLVAIFAGH